MSTLYRPVNIPSDLDVRWLSELGEIVSRTYHVKKYISVRCVSTKLIHELNRRYRGKDRPTDVLSFSNVLPKESRARKNRWPKIHIQEEDSPENLLGELLLCLPILRRQAREHRHSLLREFQILTIHGTIHLLGYDHEREADARVMERQEKNVLEKLERKLGR